MEKILVLRGGALGDFIVTLPALAALRARWPAARIELAGNATAAALAVARGLLDAAHSQHDTRWSALYAAGPLPADFAAWLASFDLVLNFWPDPDADLARRFPLRPRQRFLTAPALPPSHPPAPAALHYGAPLAALGLPPVAPAFRLSPLRSSRLLSAGPSLPGSLSPAPLVLHPGSGSPRKNWPADRWRALIDHLLRLTPPSTSLVLILGEAEHAAWPASAPATPSHVVPPPAPTPSLTSSSAAPPPSPSRLVHLRQRPLEELVSLLAGARLFLGHDSGISHLAAACGAPCLLLFGPTDPTVWAPPGDHVRLLSAGPDLAALPLERVVAALPPDL